MNELNFKLLQNKTKRFNKYNILKLKSHNEFIFALKTKYPIFFDIINHSGIQYKQFLSSFFNCIINGFPEPFYIQIKLNNNKVEKIYDKYNSSYNYLTLLPWSKNNIVKCKNKKDIINNFRVNKVQFMQALIVLFPKFIQAYPNILMDLNNKLNNITSDTISIVHLYKYLIYCGDKLAKYNYIKNSKYKYVFKLSKNKIENFLKIFTHEQLITILLN